MPPNKSYNFITKSKTLDAVTPIDFLYKPDFNHELPASIALDHFRKCVELIWTQLLAPAQFKDYGVEICLPDTKFGTFGESGDIAPPDMKGSQSTIRMLYQCPGSSRTFESTGPS